MLEREIAELTYRVLHTGSDDKVLRFLLLQDEPHALHIILGISPISQRRKVPQIQLVLLALSYACSGKSDLTCNESLATALTLVVEQDT